MTNEEILQFKQRATTLFGWTEATGEKETTPLNIPTPPIGKTKNKFHYSHRLYCFPSIMCYKLMQDLKSFQKSFPQPISLLILDNTETPKELEQIVQVNKSGFSTVRIVPEMKLRKMLKQANWDRLHKRERRKGPSYGRTALQRFLYLMGIEYEKPVFWILDDDVRLDKIVYASYQPNSVSSSGPKNSGVLAGKENRHLCRRS